MLLVIQFRNYNPNNAYVHWGYNYIQITILKVSYIFNNMIVNKNIPNDGDEDNPFEMNMEEFG